MFCLFLKDTITGEVITKSSTKGPSTISETQQLTDREDEHNRFCLAGIARTSLRCGQLRKGLDICTGKALRTNKVCFTVKSYK